MEQSKRAKQMGSSGCETQRKINNKRWSPVVWSQHHESGYSDHRSHFSFTAKEVNCFDTVVFGDKATTKGSGMKQRLARLYVSIGSALNN